MHTLVQSAAASHSSRTWARFGFRTPDEARSATACLLYRSWGVMAVRAQARLKLHGLAHVGSGSSAAASRRFASQTCVSLDRCDMDDDAASIRLVLGEVARAETLTLPMLHEGTPLELDRDAPFREIPLRCSQKNDIQMT